MLEYALLARVSGKIRTLATITTAVAAAAAVAAEDMFQEYLVHYVL